MTKKLVFKLGGDFFSAETITKFFLKFSEKYTENHVLLVVSAMKGVTRLLRLIFNDKTEKNMDDEFIELRILMALNYFQKVHMDLIDDLFLGESRDNTIIDFEAIFHQLQKCIDGYKEGDDVDKFYASVLSFGELASSKILSNYLKFIFIENKLFDARDFVVTKGGFRNANISKIKPGFEKYFSEFNILITQGFIGRSLKGHTVVLGFDGSDYSATQFANSLSDIGDPIILTFFKNVRGVFDKDPNENSDAKFISNLTKDEYSKIVHENGFVIRLDSVLSSHPNVEIHVRSFEDLDDPGTVII